MLQSNELAVGTVSGHLVVYKGSEQKPWKYCKDLGMVRWQLGTAEL